MRNIWLIMGREIVTMLRRPSFYIGALVAPLIVAATLFGFAFMSARFGDAGTPGAAEARPAGYVDQAGVVESVPPEVASSLRPFAGDAEAAAALRAGTIGSYFVIAPDYRATGRVRRVSEQATFTSDAGPDTRLMRSLLRANLAGDPEVARRLDRPPRIDVAIVGAAAPAAVAPDRETRGAVSFGLALLLAFSIVNGGGWLVQAVAEEKENRTIELVLTTVRPLHLMVGKLLGLGLIALLQLGVWLAVGRLAAGPGAAAGGLSVDLLPAGIWAWAVVFFLLGFLFLGSLMMGLGAIGASMRESGQLSGLLTILVLVPLWFAPAVADDPEGLVSRALTLLPITAPVMVMLRLGDDTIPSWELLLSAGLLVVAIAAALWLAARLFRGVTLLTGVRPTPRAIWRALRQP